MANTSKLVKKPADYKRLAHKFKALREGLGLTQKDVAEATFISPAQYGRFERAEMLDRPAMDDICRIGAFFNLSPNECAALMGLWPEPATRAVEDDTRYKAVAAFIGRMEPVQRELFLDMLYRMAFSQIGGENSLKVPA